MRKVKNFENGYVLISVLVIMIVMLVITFFLADALFSEVSIARNQKATTLSFNLAEAGVSEAIWRIQNDSGAKNTFLNSVDGQTIIPEKSLFANGSYSVIIQNTALGTATISSTGIYSFGLRSAQRKIVQNVAQATYPPPFPYDSAIFSSPAGGTSTGDLEFSTARLQIFGGSLLSGRDLLITQNSDISVEKTIQYTRNLKIKDSNVKCSCSINGDGAPKCSEAPDCSITVNSSSPQMPEIDFEAYKAVAKVQNQYFNNAADFLNLIPTNGQPTVFNGVVYVDDSFDIDNNRNLVMNGVLVSYGTINIGNNNTDGTLLLQNPGNKVSGVLVNKKLEINSRGKFSGSGLVWTGLAIDFNSSENAVDLIGGILGRRTYINNRTVTIYFDSETINNTLANPTASPVIEINHWEEEY